MAKIQAPVGVLFQGCYNPAFEEEIRKGKDKCFRFNRLSPNDREAQAEILAELLGSMGKETIITPPFWCDYGYNISVGDYFYANHNLVITDGAPVTFGNNVFIGPNVCFTTAEHPLDAEQRRRGLEIAAPITVGNDVWIGRESVIMPGVKIGDGSIIGAYAVVTRDVPPYCVVGGNPARFIKKRFHDELIQILLELKWWDFPEEKLVEFLPLLCDPDLENVQQRLKQELLK